MYGGCQNLKSLLQVLHFKWLEALSELTTTCLSVKDVLDLMSKY